MVNHGGRTENLYQNSPLTSQQQFEGYCGFADTENPPLNASSR